MTTTTPATTLSTTRTEPIAQLFIDGAWRAGSDGGTFPVVDPADGSTIADFAIASREDCLAAVESAALAQTSWAATSPRERSELLRAAYEVLTEEVETLAEIMIRENGKSYRDAIGEANYAKEFFRWFAEEAVRIPGEYRLSPSGDKRIVVDRQPIGVSLLITPWNFPAAMATRKLAPALAAGCTVILKPARETPLAAAFVVDVLRRVGFPPGVVSLVTPVPTGPIVAEMLSHPAVRKLSFTGSTEVGRELLHACADTVVSASMELGGNAPVVVLPGADLELTVRESLLAKMRNGGSACTAANRFYVHSSIHDAFVARMAEELAAVRVGSGLDHDNDLGALVSVRERDKVAGLVDGAVRDGATVVHGGRSWEDGAFYDATLVTGVRHGSAITTTEIFGPVTAVVRYDDVDEAVRMANDTVFGLMAYVFGEEREAVAVARRLEAGMVAINRGVVSDPAAPFGGVKQSGLGREGSSEGILEFLEEQYIALTS
ncbi:succinate-semialdehyde dehydrogenase / glutarate-semialdehyde dehydrogenase [Plantibacter flavus]|uniref:Succinate-semialdehyde dehydrogenase/glutarate-semialdehyde dehydrogenase n=1 Tax=Plantibacter flavus TaxID=150123 RepID=A0A3N2C7E9_9MICO|nr:NAD-dependent succinate-semialdehyde dehydrogenase [Plantibacter flavus]ROR83445.1 succinate-semialdehyde dehydrogenase/glutarate-semialdehyde dehydrogenase [Plantibacter flavus]SMG23460.1 succinate-semialdehyde dehydrogenase / glutarate-semialdehyde dehydrogenase [Plantibacter flavus]